ncbi:uncharacterized protein ACN427_010201 isoform 1-T4 [Glossina fuscipes fuscipes]
MVGDHLLASDDNSERTSKFQRNHFILVYLATETLLQQSLQKLVPGYMVTERKSSLKECEEVSSSVRLRRIMVIRFEKFYMDQIFEVSMTFQVAAKLRVLISFKKTIRSYFVSYACIVTKNLTGCIRTLATLVHD